MDLSTASVRLYRGTLYLSRVPPDTDPIFSDALTRAVGTCRWHGGHKRWAIPLSREAVTGLAGAGAVLGSDVDDWRREQDDLGRRRRRANKLKAKTDSELEALFEASGVRFRRPLFPHQKIGAAYMIALPACALLMDTGTGKTATVATAMQALFDRVPDFRRALVVAPKTILNSGWGEDIDSFSWLSWVNISDPPRRPEVLTCPRCGRVFKRHVAWRHMATHMKPLLAKITAEVEAGTPQDAENRDKVIKDEVKARGQEALYGRMPELFPPAQDTRRERLLRALADDSHQVMLINPESFKLVIDDLLDQDWDLVVVDESSMLKNPKSDITRKMQLFGGRVRRRVVMTATPRPNTSLDFWGQMAFLDQSLGGNFYEFRKKYYYQGYDGYSWNPKHEEVDSDIWNVVSDRSYRVRLQDCVDLPGETTERMETMLTPELARHYQDMLTSMSVTLVDKGGRGEKVIDTEWRIVQMNKLSQITSGYIFDNDGNAEFLADSPKVKASIDMARRVIENEDRFVVIWARYAEEMDMLAAALDKYGVSTCHGRTRNVDKNVADFKARKNRVMIAHPRSAQFGHTWVHSDFALFHSYDYSWEAFYQAKRRIYRIGQDRPVTYMVNVAVGTVDELILTSVFNKEQASDAVVDANVFHELDALMRRDSKRGRD